MKQRKILLAVGIVLAIGLATGVYVINNNRHINNRCTPVGDPREATADCAEFKYYDPALETPRAKTGKKVICSENCTNPAPREYYIGVSDPERCESLKGKFEKVSDLAGRQTSYCLVNR